jgi:hypothetical protein
MHRYVGNLAERDRPDRSLDSLAFSSDEGREAAIVRLIAWAEKEIESRGMIAATLDMTEDDRGIGSREVQSAKFSLRS